jgi:hypothetical protein
VASRDEAATARAEGVGGFDWPVSDIRGAWGEPSTWRVGVALVEAGVEAGAGAGVDAGAGAAPEAGAGAGAGVDARVGAEPEAEVGAGVRAAAGVAGGGINDLTACAAASCTGVGRTPAHSSERRNSSRKRSSDSSAYEERKALAKHVRNG